VQCQQLKVNGRKTIDDYSRDIKNGEAKREIIKYLITDHIFLSQIKGHDGLRGEQGMTGAKGDPGVSTGAHGQYITLNNASQKNIVSIGSSSNDNGIILLHDKSGNAVIKIQKGGFFTLKNGQSTHQYSRCVGFHSSIQPTISS
jgi:hypothetical protein